MKDKVVIVILSFLIILVVSFMIIFNMYINKIDKISKTIDNDIMVASKDNNNLKLKLKEIKEKNDIQNENLENMNDYIDSLNKKAKEYEK